MSGELHEEIQTAIRRYLFNPPYKGMFGTADDLTEIVMKVIDQHFPPAKEASHADPELHDDGIRASHR